MKYSISNDVYIHSNQNLEVVERYFEVHDYDIIYKDLNNYAFFRWI